MKVGVATVGSTRSPDLMSGVPAALVGALERIEVSVTAVDARIPGVSERLVRGALGATMMMSSTGPRNFRAARAIADVSAPIAAIRSVRLRRHASSLARLDGLVQIGTDFVLPPGVAPFVTYEDMTVPQAVRAGYPVWSSLSTRALRRRMDVQRRVYARARGCCFFSHWAAASAVEDYGVDDRKVHVVGVGSNHIVAVGERRWYPPRFLFLGQDWQRKNGDAVVRAFAQLRQEHPDACLDLVGEVPPQAADGVTVHGMLRLGDPEGRQRIARLLRDATCFVMPSLHEPFGIASLDAAHAGLPSIVSAAAGAKEPVGDGGIAVEPHDDRELLAAMRALSDPTLAQAMGGKANVRTQLFAWGAVAERLLRALMPDQTRQHNWAPFL